MNLFLEAFAELGIDSLDPLEVPPFGNVDLGDAIHHRRPGLPGGRPGRHGILETRSTEEVLALGWGDSPACRFRSFMLGGTTSGTFTEQAARHFIALVDVAQAFAAGEKENSFR